MILVDTSVLIDFLRAKKNPKVALLEDVLVRKIPWGINDFIYQEILQGARNEQEFDKLKAYFETVPFYFLRHGTQSFERAAMLNVFCRAAGVVVRSTIDLLTAQTAMENDLSILHNDDDFDKVARVIGDLRIYS